MSFRERALRHIGKYGKELNYSEETIKKAEDLYERKRLQVMGRSPYNFVPVILFIAGTSNKEHRSREDFEKKAFAGPVGQFQLMKKLADWKKSGESEINEDYFKHVLWELQCSAASYRRTKTLKWKGRYEDILDEASRLFNKLFF